MNGVSGHKKLERFYSGKTVFMTGSTGFKGSWLSEMLRILGATVVGYAQEPPTKPNLFSIAQLGRDIRQITGDVRDYQSLDAAVKRSRPDVVLHLAAQPLVIDGYNMPRYTFETNVMGTVNILECVRRNANVDSFLNVTTDKVYFNAERKGYGYKEEDKLDGYDPYSNSKSCSELVTHSYSNSFFADSFQTSGHICGISTARAGNVIGGGDYSANRIVPDCVRAACSGSTMIVRNPNSVRPYQHVLEPLTAYLMIAAAQVEDPSIAGWYNVGPDEVDSATTYELVKLFGQKWGSGFSWSCEKVDGPHEANYLMLNNEKIKEKIGWKPIWRIEEAIEKTIEWVRVSECGDWRDVRTCMDTQIKDYLSLV